MAKELRAAVIGLALGVTGSILGAALLSLFNDHTDQAVLAARHEALALRVKHLEEAQHYYHGEQPAELK